MYKNMEPVIRANLNPASTLNFSKRAERNPPARREIPSWNSNGGEEGFKRERGDEKQFSTTGTPS
ncbi:uncharacterized protein BDCG_03960 [Blastomyces dermatitidis ER-3]|nr:uncharacterized protein BDCG_03960 [Blastomyces dermatitidis ER-3]EEQ88840.2 hypothetical protein BDCG_03960 [Blastomyces dermatitidis ER-3]